MTNTVVQYMYRDASNYKAFSEEVYVGAITAEQRALIEANCESTGDSLLVIAEQLELEDLLGQLGGSYDDDGPWHEVYEIGPTSRAATTEETIEHFAERFRDITWEDGSGGPWELDLGERGEIMAHLDEEDRSLVVKVHTGEDGTRPPVRVWINDELVYSNPPLT